MFSTSPRENDDDLYGMLFGSVLSVNWDLVSKIRLMTHWNQEDTLLETSEVLGQPMPVQAHVLCPDTAQACQAWDLLSNLWLPESSQPMEGNGTGMPGSQLQNSSQIWNSWVSVLNTEAFAARTASTSFCTQVFPEVIFLRDSLFSWHSDLCLLQRGLCQTAVWKSRGEACQSSVHTGLF